MSAEKDIQIAESFDDVANVAQAQHVLTLEETAEAVSRLSARLAEQHERRIAFHRKRSEIRFSGLPKA